LVTWIQHGKKQCIVGSNEAEFRPYQHFIFTGTCKFWVCLGIPVAPPSSTNEEKENTRVVYYSEVMLLELFIFIVNWLCSVVSVNLFKRIGKPLIFIVNWLCSVVSVTLFKRIGKPLIYQDSDTRPFVNVASQLIGIIPHFSCGLPLEFYSMFSTFHISIPVKHLSILAVRGSNPDRILPWHILDAHMQFIRNYMHC
jgi:hypothetical protein